MFIVQNQIIIIMSPFKYVIRNFKIKGNFLFFIYIHNNFVNYDSKV